MITARQHPVGQRVCTEKQCTGTEAADLDAQAGQSKGEDWRRSACLSGEQRAAAVRLGRYFGFMNTYPGDPRWVNRAGGLQFWFIGLAGLADIRYCKRE